MSGPSAPCRQELRAIGPGVAAEEKVSMIGPPEGTRIEGKASQAGRPEQYWTNQSVLKLAGGGDPVERIVQAARKVILDAVEAGLSGAPFDPFPFASRIQIPVMPNDDVQDAKLGPSASPRARL